MSDALLLLTLITLEVLYLLNIHCD